MVSSLHEKCPNTEFFLVSIFSYSLHTFHVAHISIHCDTLLQNATDIIIKCNSFKNFITQCNKGLLQNATKLYYKKWQITILLQNPIVITKCVSTGS